MFSNVLNLSPCSLTPSMYPHVLKNPQSITVFSNALNVLKHPQSITVFSNTLNLFHCSQIPLIYPLFSNTRDLSPCFQTHSTLVFKHRQAMSIPVFNNHLTLLACFHKTLHYLPIITVSLDGDYLP
jgi:hypothetical protein